MGRRAILLVFAAVIAALGTVLVFLYVNGADARVAKQYDTIKVLTAVKVIAPGETVEAASQAAKFQLQAVPQADLLDGFLTDTSSLDGKVATTTIYPGEQIIASKFGGSAEVSVLPIPKGLMAMSVNLTDPARVAGFVQPGSEVAIFLTGSDAQTGQGFSRMLLPKVQVIGVGSTAPGQTTTTAEDGTSTVEVLPNALLTVAVTKDQAERILYAVSNGELSFGLLTPDSDVPKGNGVTERNLFS
jgi:pilus assembly protein CpaB